MLLYIILLTITAACGVWLVITQRDFHDLWSGTIMLLAAIAAGLAVILA